MYCTVENCLQLLQILIASLLMLHINIVGVVICSDNSTRRPVTCSLSLDLLSRYTVPLLQRQRHNTRKKLKLNKMLSILVMSCNFMSCKFMPCNFDGPSFSCPSFSALPIGFRAVLLSLWPAYDEQEIWNTLM